MTREGEGHPDRDAQFQHLSQPVILVDAKEWKLVGILKNSGRELRPRGAPVPAHDF
jgi:hypothetical protein